MICEICAKKQATNKVHFTFKGELRELDVCQDCADKYDLDNPFAGLPDALSLLFLGLLTEIAAKREDGDESVACFACGTTLADFRQSGSFGCPGCYTAFGEISTKMLRRIHGSTKHIGSRPAGRRYRGRELELDELRTQLDKAIEQEDFEHAAELRDMIHDLENSQLTQNE
jgi:protein arginine kinase activator